MLRIKAPVFVCVGIAVAELLGRVEVAAAPAASNQQGLGFRA